MYSCYSGVWSTEQAPPTDLPSRWQMSGVSLDCGRKTQVENTGNQVARSDLARLLEATTHCS